MVETQTYSGIKFRRYPNSDNRADRVYFTPGISDKQKGVKRLHEEIWKTHNGPIPNGHHIHHKDGDPLNNAPDNLEALPHAEHMRRHAGPASEKLRDHLASVRPKAAEWHASPEGLEWHRQNAATSICAVKPTPHTCEQCGTEYLSRPRGGRAAPRFCSNNCKSKWRRIAGLDDEDRRCVICEASFRINRYAKKQTCSKRCAGRLQSVTKTSAP